MKPVWIVSMGYGTKLAFDTLQDATACAATLEKSTMVDSTYISGDCYYVEDRALITIMQSTFLTKEEQQALKDKEDI